MATTTANGTGEAYPTLIDGRLTITSHMNEDECGCQTEGCDDCAQDAAREGAADEAAAIDNMVVPAATPLKAFLPRSLPFAHVEIVGLNGEVTMLRKHLTERDEIIARKVASAQIATDTMRDLEAAIGKREDDLELYRTDLGAARWEISKLANSDARKGEQITVLEDRLKGFQGYLREAQESANALFEMRVKHEAHIAELQDGLRMMTEMASEAAKDADKYLDNARDLSVLLDDSGKREDRAHETLMGIRALATSDALTDNEKVALILRLA